MKKSTNCLLIRDRLLSFVVLFVILVVQITSSIKWSMYFVYLRILFWKKQIILLKLEQGSDIEA
jgi:hypothetical protein